MKQKTKFKKVSVTGSNFVSLWKDKIKKYANTEKGVDERLRALEKKKDKRLADLCLRCKLKYYERKHIYLFLFKDGSRI